MTRHAMFASQADGSDLHTIDEQTRPAASAVGMEAGSREDANEDLLKIGHVAAKVAVRDTKNRVGDQLAGSVKRAAASPLGPCYCHAQIGCAGRVQQVTCGCVRTDGDHRRVFEEKQNSWNTAVDDSTPQADLKVLRLWVGDEAKIVCVQGHGTGRMGVKMGRHR